MTPLQRQLLEEDGWIIECESPFEISHEEVPESDARGLGAEYVALFLEKLYEEEKDADS